MLSFVGQVDPIGAIASTIKTRGNCEYCGSIGRNWSKIGILGQFDTVSFTHVELEENQARLYEEAIATQSYQEF